MVFHLDFCDDGVLLVSEVMLLGLESLQRFPVEELEVVHRDALFLVVALKKNTAKGQKCKNRFKSVHHQNSFLVGFKKNAANLS